jgi:hypothetical protein
VVENDTTEKPKIRRRVGVFQTIMKVFDYLFWAVVAVLVGSIIYLHTRPYVVYWFLLIGLTFTVVYCDQRFGMLRDDSHAVDKPYSFSRVQLAWWTVIVLASFIAILATRGEAPRLPESTLILLGISVATTAAARVIDVNDEASTEIVRHQDSSSSNILLDILSDENGVSIHRFQTVAFNITFGIWFISTVFANLPDKGINEILPDIEPNNLILLGLSSATYAGLKASENRKSSQPAAPERVHDEGSTDAVG